jgi:hypothetical protein
MNRHDTLKLDCNDDQLHGLYEALGKVRSTSTTVKVDRAAFAAMLTDYSKMVARLSRCGVEAVS